jgi:hypothetical protein
MRQFRSAAIAIAGLFIFLVLCSCGELDSIFPAAQTYQIAALSGKQSLEEYALIRAGDKIQPAFVDPISNDKDIAGLKVFFQSPEGAQAGRAILYTAEFDTPLPPFTPPEELEPGPYILVFQVLGGDQETLSKTEKAVYYMGSSDFEIEDIAAYLPGTSDTNMVPPGCYVLFEAKIHATGDIDPYIAWYNGRARIKSGRLSEGANRLLWKTPSQTGFQQIRAEALPFPPLRNMNPPAYAAKTGSMLKGKRKELSLPVSSKAEIQQVLIKTPGFARLNACYLFAGSLKDALDMVSQKELIPSPQKDTSKRKTKWLPAGDVYGLAIGPNDIYYTPRAPQRRSSTEWGWGSFSFRLMPLNDGIIFRASFSASGISEASGDSAALELALEEKGLAAVLLSGDQTERIMVPRLPNDKISTITIKYIIKNDSITVSLGEDEISIPVKGNLNYLEYQLGAAQIDTDSAGAPPIAVIDEFAVRYSAEPAPPESAPKNK